MRIMCRSVTFPVNGVKQRQRRRRFKQAFRHLTLPGRPRK